MDVHERDSMPACATPQERSQLRHLLRIGATEEADVFRRLLAARYADRIGAASTEGRTTRGAAERS